MKIRKCYFIEKTLLIIVFIIVANLSSFGQDNRFNIGIEGGPGFAFVWGNEVLVSHEPIFVLSGGLSFQYNLNKSLSLKLGFGYERKGDGRPASITDIKGVTIGETKAYYNFDYLTVPILFRISIGDKMKFFSNVGPYIGFLLKEEFVLQLPGIPEIVFDDTEYYNRIDGGLTAGLGISIPINKNFILSCEVRNNLGLLNARGDHIRNISKHFGFLMNSTNLLVGFAYKIGTETLNTK